MIKTKKSQVLVALLRFKRGSYLLTLKIGAILRNLPRGRFELKYKGCLGSNRHKEWTVGWKEVRKGENGGKCCS